MQFRNTYQRNKLARFLHDTKAVVKPYWNRNYAPTSSYNVQKLIDVNIASKDDIEVYNHILIDILSTSALSCIPSSWVSPYTKPGWRKAVKELHATERAVRRN